MSQGELVTAYLEGRVSRRTLIRRLVAAGVSMGAAVSYAHVLKPERAFAGADSDHYPDTSVRIVEETLDKVVDKGRLQTKIRADEDSELKPLHLRVYHLSHGSRTVIGERSLNFTGPDVRKVGIPLSKPAIDFLATKDRAKFQVVWIGFDQDGKTPNGSDKAVLED